MYCGVPSRVPTAVSVLCPVSVKVVSWWSLGMPLSVLSAGGVLEARSAARRARPKSSTLTRPSSRIITFSGLMSRWMIRFSCAAPSASAMSTSQRSRWATSGSLAPTKSRSDCPLTSSMAMNEISPASPTSKMDTALGWSSAAAVRASRRKRLARSTDSGSSSLDWSTLSATLRPRRPSRAR